MRRRAGHLQGLTARRIVLAGAALAGLLLGLWLVWPAEVAVTQETVQAAPPVSREPPRVRPRAPAPVAGEIERPVEERVRVFGEPRRPPLVVPAARVIPEDEAWVWCPHDGALGAGALFASTGDVPLVANTNSSFLWMVVPEGDGAVRLQGIDQPLLLELSWVGAREGDAVECTDFQIVGEARELRVQVVDSQGAPVEGALVSCGVGSGRTGVDGRTLCSLGPDADEVSATLPAWPAWAWAPASGVAPVEDDDDDEVEVLLGEAALAMPDRVLTDEELRELDILVEELALACDQGGDCTMYDELAAEVEPAHARRREQVMEEHHGEPPPLPAWEP